MATSDSHAKKFNWIIFGSIYTHFHIVVWRYGVPLCFHLSSIRHNSISTTQIDFEPIRACRTNLYMSASTGTSFIHFVNMLRTQNWSDRIDVNWCDTPLMCQLISPTRVQSLTNHLTDVCGECVFVCVCECGQTNNSRVIGIKHRWGERVAAAAAQPLSLRRQSVTLLTAKFADEF